MESEADMLVVEDGEGLETPANLPEEKFLRVYLSDRPLLLPVNTLVEIMKLSIGQVVPMFHMAPWVMGVYNWRGDMLWIADLGHFFGLPPWYQQVDAATKHTVVVITPPSAPTAPGDISPSVGCVVSQIDGMVTYPLTAVQSSLEGFASDGDAHILPFLKGYCQLEAAPPQGILASATILNAMAQAHR